MADDQEKLDVSTPIIDAAIEVARKIKATALFAYASGVPNVAHLKQRLGPGTELVLVVRTQAEEDRATAIKALPLHVPAFNLTRMGQIKMATVLAFTKQILKAGDTFVFLSGLVGQGVDTMVTMRVGAEYELFQSVGQPRLTEHIRSTVFERVLTLVMELAHEGREGKSVGALFTIGDHREVLRFAQEGRLNPLKGYAERERNVLDEAVGDVVKELAKLDGAFVLKGNGVIVSAGTILRPALAGEALPPSLGARHAAAAAITANTKCVAMTLSESTGTVRIWRRGQMIIEIERSLRDVLQPADLQRE